MTEILTPLTERSAPSSTRYLPIEEHGVIGDLRSVALVGTDGTIDWYCPGRFDAPSVFAALLDSEKGGYFRIRPTGDGWKSRQLYFPDTNVLITRFSSHEGVAEVIDFMPVMRPGDGGRDRIVRTVLGIRGELSLGIEVDPRFDYALRAGAQAPHLRAHRRHCRRRDDEPARAARWRAQLGLSLHVDPRRLLLALRAAPFGVHGGGGCLRRVARRSLPRAHAGRIGPAADHVRDRREPRSRGDHARSPRGLPWLGAGSGGERRRGPASARHLRRARRLRLPL